MTFRGCKAAALFVLIDIYFSLAFHLIRSPHVHQKLHHRLPLSQRSLPNVPKIRLSLAFAEAGWDFGLVHEVIGTPPSKECCTLIAGLADLEAAPLCL